ncbi:MAG TPA: hypothetical protein VFI96_05865 [Longimicrobiaceae bacterium]|nr:hypothetical protein [Longimicrobiaceae bacterium]
MSEQERVGLDPAFDFLLPEGWTAEADEEGGVQVYHPEGEGLLHLMAFEQPPGEVPDPGEELYVFLDEQEIELHEDEIEDVELGERAELSFCEYQAEEEDEETGEPEETYWLVGVAVAPGTLVFCTYSCAADTAEVERGAVLDLLRSLRLREVA